MIQGFQAQKLYSKYVPSFVNFVNVCFNASVYLRFPRPFNDYTISPGRGSIVKQTFYAFNLENFRPSPTISVFTTRS